MKGQDYAKRAILIAAAGSHNILMIGPPGTGKTLLAKRLPTILPPLTPAESLETTRIYSAMGLLKPGQPLMAIRPFRSPHHSVSDAGLVGGGTTPQPGEISLAHKGVLFLDEMPEFNRKTLEVLRQPLEEGYVHDPAGRCGARSFPAEFILVAAMNPCPARGYPIGPPACLPCTPPQVEKYLNASPAHCSTASTSTSRYPPSRSLNWPRCRPARLRPTCGRRCSRREVARPGASAQKARKSTAA